MGLLGSALKIGGSLLGGSSSGKAAKEAAQAQRDVAKMNNDLVREMYGRNEANIQPYMNRGDIAGAYINALLGIPGNEYTTEAQGAAQPAAGTIYPWTGTAWEGVGNRVAGARPGGNAMLGGQTTTTRVTPITARQAYNTFQNSTGYKSRYNQGMDALNNGLAQGGMMRSGRAMKDAMRFGQDYASNEFGRYIGYLGNQQGLGLQGAGALAGVGMQAAGTMSNNNQNAADAMSNSALLRGQANAGMWSNIGNAVGNLFGSSFGGSGGQLDQTIKPVSGINPGQYLS